MYVIRYTLTTGETRQSQPFFDHETANRWRRLLLQGSQVTGAEIVSAGETRATVAA